MCCCCRAALVAFVAANGLLGSCVLVNRRYRLGDEGKSYQGFHKLRFDNSMSLSQQRSKKKSALTLFSSVALWSYWRPFCPVLLIVGKLVRRDQCCWNRILCLILLAQHCLDCTGTRVCKCNSKAHETRMGRRRYTRHIISLGTDRV